MSRLVRVASVAEIPVGRGKALEVDGVPLAVFNTGGGHYQALSGSCPHEGGPLGNGILLGDRVVCPWHGFDFDVRTGVCNVAPDLSVTVYPVRLTDTDVLVELPLTRSVRRRLLPIGIALAVLAAAAYGTWTWLAGRHQVSTEDAYVEGAVVVISARVPGPVAKVHVRDNENVQSGQLLVEIDPRDSQIRVEQARAAVAMATADARGARSEVPLARESTESRLQQARATLAAARVAVDVSRAEEDEARARAHSRRAAAAAAQADVAVAESTADRTRLDLDRSSRLATGGLIAQQELDAIRTAHRSALATLDAARRRVAQAERDAEAAEVETRRRALSVQQTERRVDEVEALVADAQSQQTQVPVKEAAAGRAGASIEQAQAELAAAELQLAKTRIVAPAGGAVSKKTVEAGQMVQVGQPLLAIVPLEGVWVVANLKETQVGRVRSGQPVTIRVDTFPDRLFRGRVDSISAGTGSRFSLLPPENASGNWVKVVQRVPVKILLEDYHANPHLLRAGMSALVTIDVR